MKNYKLETFIVALIVLGYAAYFVVTHPGSFWNKPMELVEDTAESVIEKDLGLPPGTIDLNNDRAKQ